MLGDVNCNDLNFEDRNKVIDHLRGLYRQFQMKQLIKFPTRSTLTSQTLTDHFASNRPSHIIDSGVFTTGFSDHDLIYGIVVMYYTPGHLCPGCVVHYYSYPSVPCEGTI